MQWTDERGPLYEINTQSSSQSAVCGSGTRNCTVGLSVTVIRRLLLLGVGLWSGIVMVTASNKLEGYHWKAFAWTPVSVWHQNFSSDTEGLNISGEIHWILKLNMFVHFSSFAWSGFLNITLICAVMRQREGLMYCWWETESKKSWSLDEQQGSVMNRGQAPLH